jgi:hypothetical protein
MSMLQKLNKMLMKPLALLENKYIAGGVKLFLILYAALIAPKLPAFIAKLLKNPIVKLTILFLIIYTGIKDPMMSLLIAVGFTVSMLTLNKLETVGNLNELIDGAIDVPQSLLNDVIDGAQDLTGAAADLIGSPVKEVSGVVEKLVDGAQEIANKVIDGAQELVTGVKESTENFSMEDRTMSMSMEVPDMGSLDGLSGFDGNVVGAEL